MGVRELSCINLNSIGFGTGRSSVGPVFCGFGFVSSVVRSFSNGFRLIRHWLRTLTLPDHLCFCRLLKGLEKSMNTKEYLPEAGFNVLPAVPGRRATFHERFPIGLGWFVRRSGTR